MCWRPSDEDDIGSVDNWLEQAQFEDARAEVKEAERCYFQLQSENYKPLYLVVPGLLKDVENYGYLLSTLFSEILKTSIRKPGREEIFKALLLDQGRPAGSAGSHPRLQAGSQRQALRDIGTDL